MRIPSKRRTAALAVIVSVVILSSASFLPAASAAPQAKIGVSLPLTGVAAAYGNDIRRILEYLNERGPGYQLIVEDDKCDPKEAVSIAQRFTTVDRVALVLGMPCSGAVLAVAPIYERARIPLIAIGPGAPKLSGIGKWIFRSRPSDEGSVCILGKHLAARHKKVSVVAEQTEFAQALADFFSTYSQLPARSLARHDYLSTEPDFRTLIASVKADGSDAVVLFSQGEPTLASLVRTLKDLNVRLPVYSATFPGSPTFLNLAGAAANGIEFSRLAPREIMLNEMGRKLLNDFESRRGPMITLDYGFAVTETAFVAATEALKQQGDLSEFLHTASFDGSIGRYSFNSAGDLLGMRYVLQRIQDGKAVTLPLNESFDECF